MNDALSGLALLSSTLRTLFTGIGVVLAVVAVLDWAARTRRISPFGGIARFMRTNVDPRLAGVERQVLRIGGHPTATPWWALVLFVVVAALVLAAVDMLAGFIAEVLFASTVGASGIVVLLVRWAFALLRLALLLRVLSSWFPRMAHQWWVRWSFGATEWMLRPLRGIIPSLGLVDLTPIVAYFALQLIEGLVTRLLFSGAR